MSKKNKISDNNNKSTSKKKFLNIQILKYLMLMNKKNYLMAIAMLIFTATTSFFIFKTFKPKKINELPKDNITIFTHGSFGSFIGLMNLFQVMKDNVSGTIYKKTINRMRKDPKFYSSQPIMQKGLIKIQPSYDLSVTSSERFAAYPILKAYEELNNQIYPTENKNHYYTFGWSGLISQKRRRKEAIRFYNSLCEELDNSFNQPKLRILAHSHGGNLALNLAAVNKVINNLNNLELLLESAKTEDEKEALFLMYKEIISLPSKSDAKKNIGQKKLDYIPEKKDLKIDELLIFGCPIQVETEAFVLSDFFKKIYHIYSDDDIIQSMDGFSTKKDSKQRIKITKNIGSTKILNDPRLIQLKIMIDRGMEKNITNGNKITTLSQSMTGTSKSFWKKLFSAEKRKDPSHKGMWFVSWDKLKNNISHPLESIPSVIFTPLLLNAIETVANHSNDLDINIKLTEKKLKAYLFDHKTKNKVLQHKVSISKDKVDSIKNKLMEWIPDDISLENEFNRIKNYQIKNS